MQANPPTSDERIKSAIGVAALHAALGYALIAGLGIDVSLKAETPLKLFDVAAEQPPPPPPETETAARREAAEGPSSPPNLAARPTEIVAPPPEIRLAAPPPLIAAPAPGTGSEPEAGASDRPGPGSGSGGAGDGNGGGGRGGGIAARAQWASGRIAPSDYPRAAWRARAGGTVEVRFRVGSDGRPGQCAVTRSSGRADLDETTCRLIERRFRYTPARDARGRAVADLKGWKQDWWLE